MWRSYIRMNKDKTLHFLINGRAGAGKKKNIWKQVLKPELIRSGVHFRAYESTSTKAFVQNVERIQAEQDGVVTMIVVGGDGTFNETLNHIPDFSRVVFGFIPTGSANDLGYALGIPADPLQALRRILQAGSCERLDIGRTTFHESGQTRYFAISSGAGLDAGACSLVGRGRMKAMLNRLHLGVLAYGISAVRLVVGEPLADAQLRFVDRKGNEQVRSVNRLYFLAAMNQPNEGGHLIMAPNATARDGMLSFAFASGLNRGQALVSLVLLVMRRTDLVRAYEVIDARSCTLQLTRAQEVHTDGETFGGYTQLTFECLPKQLQMLL